MFKMNNHYLPTYIYIYICIHIYIYMYMYEYIYIYNATRIKKKHTVWKVANTSSLSTNIMEALPLYSLKSWSTALQRPHKGNSGKEIGVVIHSC